MIRLDDYRHFCCEPLQNIENYQDAVNDTENVWICHHILGETHSMNELISKGLYFNRPASEFRFMKRGEHIALHHKGKQIRGKGWHHSEESKQKMSKKQKGRLITDETKRKMRKPHKLSDEVRQANKDRYKGKTWKLVDGKRVWINKQI